MGKISVKKRAEMKQVIENTKLIFDENGEVNFGGWSKAPLFEYNKENINFLL